MRDRPLPPSKAELLRAAHYNSISLGRRRRLVGNAEPSTMAQAMALARDGMACSCCGTAVVGRPYSVRRRNPRSGDSLSNLLTFLGDGSRRDDPADHRARVDSGRDPADAARGFTVPSGHDPALVPVLVCTGPHSSWVTLWLTSEGTYGTKPPPGVV